MQTDPALRVRPLQAHDIAGVMAVQQLCYGDSLMENAEVYLRRALSPAGRSLVAECDGRVYAYLAAYQSVQGKVTPLHGDFEPVPYPDTLYLHDMAVLPALAARGLARALLTPLWQQAMAEGLCHSALVSVQGSQDFWQRQGYVVQALAHAKQRQHLAGYGSGASYMVRALAL